MADTYDPDEFVYLALGRDVGHGSIPYRDFDFFHPPGMLVILGLLDHLSVVWWPLVRMVDVLVDSSTAVLVWRLGLHLSGRRAALTAGILYAINPVVLVYAVRIDQEIVITALGMLGLTLLLTSRSSTSAILAGLCLALACWIKYPALVFVPIYALAAPRRMPACLLGWLAVSALLFAPYLTVFQALFDQSVAWQLVDRHRADSTLRLHATVVFWLLANPLAAVALLRTRKPAWLLLGFASGAIFFFTSSTYAHYFVPVAPFAALLGAVGLVQVGCPSQLVVAAAVALTGAWTADIRVSSPGHGLATGYRFSTLAPTMQLLERSVPRGTPVLADHFEYAYLSGHPWVAHFFWNAADLVDAQTLERRIIGTSVVVSRPLAGEHAYPAGFLTYVRTHGKRVHIPGTTIWMMTRRAAFSQSSASRHYSHEEFRQGRAQ